MLETVLALASAFISANYKVLHLSFYKNSNLFTPFGGFTLYLTCW